MKSTPLAIPDIILLEPKIFNDDRGFFFESFNKNQLEKTLRKKVTFVQDNHSCSIKNVLRGLHYQIQHPQGKLVRVIQGEIFDVAVDIRKSSPTFGKWVSTYLSADNKHQLWIPEGFAHGFLTLSEKAEVLYKTTDYWFPEYECSLAWNDPNIRIQWPCKDPQVSVKDKMATLLQHTEIFA